MRPLRIAIASGKGGTGKTTLATSLARVIAEQGLPCAYLDCDVEEPNGHLFLNPRWERRQSVGLLVPEVDEGRCTACGACGRICRYSAILVLSDLVLTYPKLCHSCGGCSLVCPTDAIQEVERVTGRVDVGHSEGLQVLRGTLDIGEAMAPPVVRGVLREAPEDHTLVIDAPPGTSCPVIESVKDADVVLLVTEPTPFGLNDLKLAVELLRALERPFGVAVNRAGLGDRGVYDYCEREDLPLLLELPNDKAIAAGYSRGELVVDTSPQLRPRFTQLFEALKELARQGPRPRPTASAEPDAASTPELKRPAERPVPSSSHAGAAPERSEELIVISGKGGTGKTSILASFAALASKEGRPTFVDCDVDAADLHLVLKPQVKQSEPFVGGSVAEITPERCTACGRCAEACRFDAIHEQDGAFSVKALTCEGCGVCVEVCPEDAAQLRRAVNGAWFLSDTDFGPMAHARLGVAQENSGKLVSLLRQEGRALHQREAGGASPLLGDGSPGIGCPVIASVTHAGLALVVTEPTLSGLHDLERVAELTAQLGTRTGLCINKADLNPEMSSKIEAFAAQAGLPVLGRIRYDEVVTRAQVRGLPLVELGPSDAGDDVRALWEAVKTELASARGG